MGIVSNGKLKNNTKYYLGPDSNGNFLKVAVSDIYCKKKVSHSYKEQYYKVSIKSLKK